MANTPDQLLKWAQLSQNARHMNVIAKHAAPYMRVAVDQLDAHPFLFNVKNGTLIFEQKGPRGFWTVRLKAHDPADLLTRLSPVVYDPTSRCPTYDAALALVQPDKDVRDFLHRAIGYAATGDIREQKAFFFYGEGRNGKSTFVDLWSYILGDYAATIGIETFLDTNHTRDAGAPSPHLARLRAVRFLRTSEPEKGATLAEAFIKLATSGEPIAVRHLQRNFFDLRPQFKLFISGNYKPRIKGTDEGIWRRIALVPWPVKITDEQCTPNLNERLKDEASGILNRIVEGCCAWLNHGLAIPPSISEATAEYRSASDDLGRFLERCTRQGNAGRVSSQDLYGLYYAWAKASGVTLWSRTGFGRAMHDRGFQNAKSGNHVWLGLELTATPTDFQEQPPSPDDPVEV